ncbi:MAG: hypothetical protein C0459_09915 [Chitinophaga sp.]|jgi:hypothetical protein|nr:hypothetical protein [Chitinophaga sp.]
MEALQIDNELTQRIAQLNISQKESLLKLLDSLTNDDIDLIEYSKELEEANAAIDAGEFYTHQQALQLINGK